MLLAVAALGDWERSTPRRTMPAGLAIGAAGYATQSGLYFTALSRTDAALVAMLFCTYPICVLVVAVLTFTVWSTMDGGVDLAAAARSWIWLLLLALVSTVAAILLFFWGLTRVGPTTTALVSVVEPVVAVSSAALVLGNAMAPRQALGGAVVLGAVLLSQWRRSEARVVTARVPEAGVRRPALGEPSEA